MFETWPDRDVIGLARAYAVDLTRSMNFVGIDGTIGKAPESLPEVLLELAKRLEERHA